jgi:hypothetical protein
LGLDPSMTATQELVVPRSMPMILAISPFLSFQISPGPEAARPSDRARRHIYSARRPVGRSPSLQIVFGLHRRKSEAHIE